jgi:hypothetical protein
MVFLFLKLLSTDTFELVIFLAFQKYIFHNFWTPILKVITDL